MNINKKFKDSVFTKLFTDEQKLIELYNNEVLNMLYTEFNFDDALAVSREEGFEDGIEKGIEKGREEGIEKKSKEILGLIKQGFTLEQIEDKIKETILH